MPGSRPSLYRRNGLQFLPFNTLYQLAAARASASFASAKTFLLMPDLFATGSPARWRPSATNASTTGLLDPRTREWAVDLIDDLGFPRDLFPPLRDPGRQLGPIRGGGGRRDRQLEGTAVTSVGSHDTASAVVAVPASDDRFAYISSGTWSLVGLELEPADPVRRQPGGELHQRRRRRRTRPVPPERDGPVVAPGNAAGMGPIGDPGGA